MWIGDEDIAAFVEKHGRFIGTLARMHGGNFLADKDPQTEIVGLR